MQFQQVVQVAAKPSGYGLQVKVKSYTQIKTFTKLNEY
jgi:hypothetical protein